MRIVVPLKAVPDLVEEIELNDDGTDIEREYLKFVLNEWDDQALEEALLIKDAGGAEVVAVALADDPDIEQALYTAMAKGADAAVKIDRGSDEPTDTHARAAAFAAYLKDNPADLVITGVQAPDDLDGQLPPALAAHLGQPHVSVVVSVEPNGGSATVRQEFSGGRAAELKVDLPAVGGLQAARQAPRYAPVSTVRAAQQAGGLSEVTVAPLETQPPLTVRKMYPPVSSSHAEMLTGEPEEIAEKIIELLRDRALIKE